MLSIIKNKEDEEFLKRMGLKKLQKKQKIQNEKK